MKAIGYIRVSTEEQASEGVSLEAQRERIEAYAMLYDLELVDIYEDAGESASSLARPGLDAALMVLENHGAEAIVVAKLDRLTRSLKDLLDLIDQYFAGDDYVLMSVAEQLDPRTASGRLVINILAAVAQWELETISERTKVALAHKRMRGEYTGGGVPYGYFLSIEGKLERDETEQAAISYAKEMRASGWTLRNIGKKLDEYAPSRTGNPWTAGQIRRLVKEK